MAEAKSGTRRDRPWIMRTYAGHSTAAKSNALYRKNLAKGQTGLSVAFDLPTQTGYDADHPLARGEVGKVGVPISHLGDMRTLFEGLTLTEMNTSMTINATAAWLFSLYAALAEEKGEDVSALRGTTQNDIIKEFLARGTYAFPPAPSMRLITDVIAYTVEHVPKWNPINICSYHLQEAGATPVQELAYALATAIAVLDAAREKVPEERFPKVVGRISFFVNAGIRFVEEMCKMRAFVDLWDRICRERYGVEEPKLRRFRYGIQVNSLGLTEQQPENNIIRIVLEMLAVTLSKDARARAIQLPAWNEALGLPRPWDQQWSLRAQQILAFETDLLENDDLFNGSHVVEAKTKALADAAWAEVEEVLSRGGAVAAVESGYIKQQLVESNAARIQRIEAGEQTVVGVNAYQEGEPSPLVADLDDAIMTVDPAVEAEQEANLQRWREARDEAKVEAALAKLREAAAGNDNLVPPSIAAAHAGVTTGEWAATLRQVFGEYRAPTGVSGAASTPSVGEEAEVVAKLRARMDELTAKLGRRPKLLVGKPGLDGHSNGAEQIAIKARDVGFDVVYEGIRVTPEQLVASALEEGVHLIGLSILSGSHMELVPDVIERLRKAGLEVPVVVGGIIPESDAKKLEAKGVARVYTPKDFALNRIMEDLVALVGGPEEHAA
ncbi:MAG TPA: protein meaA [Polyangiaceae bacterium LLY-WYZ-15_(1-7)]|nr:protein meaA [Myxococcales bacterium]MBJ73586.1 protein meaA [Sandaracinus sp.]HJL03300.1 protein meaA [Polyangiaceae bacterium LLY-WYZ-15_(1-7)]HJL10681.1 protein meaA [Polyangiaceae bacterium LLY-WYZ-15_(1-7)]HJL25808.1 protein meaA [Polyangiaceae bacterium LLY-WYZ-15_(1-7)]